MALTLFRRAKKKRIAIIDIASASAAVGIVETDGTSSRVLSEARAVLPSEARSEEQALMRLSTELQEAGTKTLNALARDSAPSAAIDTVYAIVHAPWCRTQTAEASANFPHSTKVTSRTIESLARDALGHTGIDRKALIEASVVRVEINGYPTPDPEGKLAKSVTVHALVSDCEPRLSSALSATAQALFPEAKILWRSSSRELCAAARELGVGTENYLIADMQGDATDFIVVQDGVPQAHFVTPIGTRAMLEAIAPNSLPEETLTTIEHILKDECDDAPCQEIAASMAKAEPEFARTIGEVFAKDLPKRRLPNTLVLIGRNRTTEWLSRFFSRIDFSQFTTTQQPFSVVPFTENDLSSKLKIAVGPSLDLSVELGVALVNIERSAA